MSRDTSVGYGFSNCLYEQEFVADYSFLCRHLLDLHRFAVQHYFQAHLLIVLRLYLLPDAERI